jgi:tetratricopeptide (TPR) repeat protein
MHALFLAAMLSLAAPGEDPDAAVPAPVPVAIEAAPPAAVMTMPPELRERLQDEVLSQPMPQRERLEQLLHFMLDAGALGITYDERATHSIAQTYAARRANCLSFTLMFLAIAREAGLDAHAQEIENTLSWRQEDNTIYRNNHVNARVDVKGGQFVVDTSGFTLIAGSKPIPISDRRLLAHYYNNLAMEELARENAAAGLRLMDAALAADASYAPLWSNAGVLYVHAGDLAAAGNAYQKALRLDPNESGALFNMVSLARRFGDARREEELRRRLVRVQQKDPLHQFMRGMDYERSADYALAIKHYRRAIRLYPGEHRFYSALARVYLKAGNPQRAGNALKRAQALTDGATRAAYRAQLQALEQRTNN